MPEALIMVITALEKGRFFSRSGRLAALLFRCTFFDWHIFEGGFLTSSPT